MKPLFITTSLLLATAVHADKIRGTVDVIKTNTNNTTVIFSLNAKKEFKFSCASAKSFGFDAAQPAGAITYEALIAAQATDKPIKVITDDVTPCLGNGDIQAISQLIVGAEKDDLDEDIRDYEAKLKAK
jgi:hypothetical protein